MDATDLTQLSSREQLSALMDGALPADETRFLLRRLQHDDSLAECWERWRLSAEVMRGLAPAQRLPADFASRVAASLRGQASGVEAMTATLANGKRATGSSGWLRWGGGVAVAASLAVVAFMTLPAAVESPVNGPGNMVASADGAQPHANATLVLADPPGAGTPAPRAPAQDPAGNGFEAQTAALASVVAAVARPERNNRRGSQARATRLPSVLTESQGAQAGEIGIAAASKLPPLLPQADVISRPWPRSVLPQYASAGITVGFTDNRGVAAPYNPFHVRKNIGNLPPPSLIFDSPARVPATSVDDDTNHAPGGEQQP